MEKNQILPVLNTEVLQEKANEFAMKGASESLREFYSGYNSPYRKAIDEALAKNSIGTSIELPDIIALINEALSKEIDLIANAAISKTFIPLVHKFITREEKNINFSDLLKQFIECTEAKDYEDCEVEIKRHSTYSWLSISLTSSEKNYSITLHEDFETRKDTVKKYQLLSLPYDNTNCNQTMKLIFEGGVLEMPFTKDILHDNFISYIARLVIGNTRITMDCESFSEEMFPNPCYCH
jgi:hypothetical protein